MISIRETATKWTLNNENVILFSFLSENYFHIKLFKFNSKEINNKTTIITIKEYRNNVSNNVLGKSISCFITNLNITLCMYLIGVQKSNENNYISKYYIIALDDNLLFLTKEVIEIDHFDKDSFYKCIYLRYALGIFSYYSIRNNFIFPNIRVKYYNAASKTIKEYHDFGDIELNFQNTIFNTYSLLNDIIKVSNNTICFSTTSENKEILYIVLINIEEYIIIKRYYSIEVFNLYGYKFLFDMKMNLYNNFIALFLVFVNKKNVMMIMKMSIIQLL